MIKKDKLTAFFFILSVLFMLNLSSAVEVVQVPKEEPQKQGIFSSMFGFLKEPIFWYIVIAFIIFVIIGIGLFFLVRWLVKFIKQRNDVFFRMKQDRMILAKVHRRYPSTHWWKNEKNTPVRLAKKDEDGRLIISRPIGYHRGDYITHEGNMIIWLNLIGKKQYMIFPASDLLVIPNKAEIKIVQRNEKGERVREDIYKLPVAKDIVQFNEGEILLFAEGVSNVGIFLIPVLKSKDGKIIDLALPIYSSLQEVVIGDFLYEQSASFVGLAKKAVDMNVDLRARTKLQDSNQNVDVSTSNHG